MYKDGGGSISESAALSSVALFPSFPRPYFLKLTVELTLHVEGRSASRRGRFGRRLDPGTLPAVAGRSPRIAPFHGSHISAV
jgi:hypothetical protein